MMPGASKPAAQMNADRGVFGVRPQQTRGGVAFPSP